MSMMNNNGDEPSNKPACASCKHQRKKCQADCVMARHFPSSRMEEFQAVHRLFGISNVSKMLKDLDFRHRNVAVKSIIWEASMWKQDPISGPFGQYKRLEAELQFLKQKTYTQLALQSMAAPPAPEILWRGGNNINAGGVVPYAEDVVPFIQNNGNLPLELSVNTYTNLLQGQDREIQERAIQGRGFQGNFVQIEERENGGRQSVQDSYYSPGKGQERGIYNGFGQGSGSHGRDYVALFQRSERESQRTEDIGAICEQHLSNSNINIPDQFNQMKDSTWEENGR